MLPGGGHIEIDGKTYFIEENLDLPFPHYDHFFEPLQDRRQQIEGDPKKLSLRLELLAWKRTDFIHGEGDKFFDPEDPNLYHEGDDVNTRISGQVAHAPTHTTVQVDV